MRNRERIKKDYGILDIYDYYLDNYDNTVDYNTFRSFLFGTSNARQSSDKGVINDFKYEILHKAYALVLGRRLGILQVRKRKPKIKFNPDGSLNHMKSKMSVDWKATKRYWEHNPDAAAKKIRVFYDNKHTHGYKMKIFWDKSNCNFKHKKVYRFQPVREFNRSLNKVIRSSHTIDYYEF